MANVAERALDFALQMHAGQKRKYTGEPYITHPIAVAAILRDHGFDEEVIAAAYLHDVVEDTPATYDQLIERFGYRVANLVADVTDRSRPEDGNRARRKEIDRQHLMHAHPDAQSIKVADLIDNTKSIVERDPSFARVYLREKAQLLAVLTDAHPALLARAWEQVDATQNR